jgi:hypothetical protein
MNLTTAFRATRNSSRLMRGVGEGNMNFEILQRILYGLIVLDRIESALWLGSLFVCVTVYYILYQMFKLRFLIPLLIGELLYIPNWFWMHRHLFFERSDPPNPGHDELFRMVLLGALDFGFRFLPFCFTVIGAVMALNYLQRKWKEQLGESPTTIKSF